MCLATAHALDESERSSDAASRAAAANRAALLTPIAKAFATDCAVEVASLGVQVHGGSGFIEGTGAAQHYRDARILPIYEGTNGVQAIDLVTRKLPLDGGKVVAAYLSELDDGAAEIAASNLPGLSAVGANLAEANAALRQATEWLAQHLATQPDATLAGATPYLRLFGIAAGGIMLGTSALKSARGGADAPADRRRLAIAKFFAASLSPGARGLATVVVDGAKNLPAAGPEWDGLE